MQLELLFKAATLTVLPFWLLLVVAPRWRWTQRLVHGPVVVLLLTPIYGYMVFGYAPAPREMSFLSLYGLMIGFSSPHLVMAGWVHYLIFDLFVGAWESRDAVRRRVPHWLVVPCLLGTLMFGPIGLLLYITARFFSVGALEYEETGDL
jgi:hypothetical protein